MGFCCWHLDFLLETTFKITDSPDLAEIKLWSGAKCAFKVTTLFHQRLSRNTTCQYSLDFPHHLRPEIKAVNDNQLISVAPQHLLYTCKCLYESSRLP